MPTRSLLLRAYAFFALPLPAKLFLSYLFVVLVGAVPTYFYLKQLLLSEFMNDAVQRVTGHAQLLANFLTREPELSARVVEIEHLAPILTERLSYISAGGRTLFDSSIADTRSVENQLDKPEVARALGLMPIDESFQMSVPHIGISRRYSDTTGGDTLYVAVKLVDDDGDGADLLRLAIPIAELEQLSVVLVRVFRNSQAAAVSAAMVLSLMAAAVFMRPLQRLSKAAQSLAAGDYTVVVPKLGNDEIADVGRSLTLLGQQLRKRLAQAEAGEAMLIQLVQGLTVPVAICAPDGRIVVANGAARDMFGREQSQSEHTLLAFMQSEDFSAAISAAKMHAEPEHVSLGQHVLGVRICGWVHVLTHPSGPPFFAFFGEEAVSRPRVYLPRPNELQSITISDALNAALAYTQPHIKARNLALVMESAPSTLGVCDTQQRVCLALTMALCGLDVQPNTRVPLSCIDKPTRIAVIFGAPLTDAAKEIIGGVLAPMGGQVKVYPDRTLVILCRA